MNHLELLTHFRTTLLKSHPRVVITDDGDYDPQRDMHCLTLQSPRKQTPYALRLTVSERTRCPSQCSQEESLHRFRHQLTFTLGQGHGTAQANLAYLDALNTFLVDHLQTLAAPPTWIRTALGLVKDLPVSRGLFSDHPRTDCQGMHFFGVNERPEARSSTYWVLTLEKQDSVMV